MNPKTSHDSKTLLQRIFAQSKTRLLLERLTAQELEILTDEILNYKTDLDRKGCMKREPCFFCKVAVVQMTPEHIQEVRTRYHKGLTLRGFHCADPSHTALLHEMLDCPQWSCCLDLPTGAED